MEQAAIFIDGANMFYTQRSLGWGIDFQRLRDHLASKYRLVSAKYYVSYKVPPAEDQKKFHRFLATNGYSLRTKILKEIIDKETGEKTYKGNLDIELVVDALTSMSHYDIFILFSGDGDFVPLIRALKASGKKVHAYSTRGFSSIELVSELGMDFHDLQELRSLIEYRDTGAVNRQKSNEDVLQEKDMVFSTDKSKLPEIGDNFEAKGINVKPYGIFLSNPWGAKVLLPISQFNLNKYINDLPSIIREEDIFQVEVINIDTAPIVTEVTVKLVDNDMKRKLKERLNRP